MSGRPAEPIPTWSENGAFPAGTDPWSATATKVAPSFAERKAGHVPNAQQPAQYENSVKNASGRWIDFLADVGVMNWGPRLSKDSAAASLTLSYNGSSGAQNFWSDYHNAWIVTGQNTNGKFFVGDANQLDAFTFGGQKWAHGAVTNNGKILLVNSDVGATINYNLINAAISGGAPSTLPGVSLNGFASSTIKLASNTLLICGSGEGTDANVWRSTDNGTSWTKITVSAGLAMNNSRMVERAGTILLGKKDAVTGQVMKSTDDGVTWSVVTTPAGFDNIFDMWYSPEEDRFIFAAPDRLFIAGPDLVFTSTRYDTLLGLASTDGKAVGVFGSAILLFTDEGAARRRIFMSWDLGQHWRSVGRSPYSGAPRIAVSSLGQFFTSSVLDVAQTLACCGIGATARGE